MANWREGAFQVRVAYEHTLTERQGGAGSALLFTSGGATSNGDWLDLGGVVESGGSLDWRHRFDRLSVAWDLTESAELIVGRQPVSWATTLIFTPADPFSPFDPSDPFRVYRQGVDAARLRVYPGAVSEVDLVLRRSDFGLEETTTAALRGSTSFRGWDVAGWGGVVHDRGAGAISLSGGFGSWAVRGEGTLRSERSGTVVRTAIGVDRFLVLAGRDLYLVVEYLHDGFGIREPSEYTALLTSGPARRGELQSVGRDEGAIQATYQVHPLVGLTGLLLVNLRDGSALFAPGASLSSSASTSVTAGAYLSSGADGFSSQGFPNSEFGVVPGVVYVSFSWFF